MLPNKSTLGRKTLLIIANNFVGGVLGWLILFIIARYMIASDYSYGVVAFALGFLGMFKIILSPGTNSAHIKRVSEGRDVGKCVGTYLAIKVVLTLTFLLIVFGALIGWQSLLGKGFESPKHKLAIYILIFNFVLTSFNGVFISTFIGKKEVAKAQVGKLLSTISRLATVLIVVGFQLGILGLAMTWNISMLVYFTASFLLFKGYDIKKPSWALAKNYMSFSLPLLFTTLAGTLAVTTDRVMIQLFWRAQDVGHYEAAWRITLFITFFAVAVQKLVFPTISQYHKEKKQKMILLLTWNAEKYIGLFIAPICFFTAFFPRDIIHIMVSDKFMPGAPVLSIFAFYSFLVAINIPYTSQFVGMDRPGINAAIGVPRYFLNIILNLVLIAPGIYGIRLLGLKGLGAALGTLISMSISFVVTRYVVYRYLTGTKSNWRIILNAIAAFLMALFLKYLIRPYVPIERFYHLFFYAGVGAVVYFAIMFLFRQFTRKEIDYILGVINPKEMYLYIKEELFG